MPRKGVTQLKVADNAEGAERAVQVHAAQVSETPVGVISRDRFLAKIQALKERETIRNDRDINVPFEGETKEDFIRACEESYPMIERTLSSMYELGGFLCDVRDRLKPKKLYHTWLEITGIPERTARNYVQAYERYTDRLPQFAYLGIKKLLIASRLEDCVEYVQKHEDIIAEQTADELEREIKALCVRNDPRGNDGRGRKPMSFQVGAFRICPSVDGTKLRIEGLSKDKQARLITLLKAALSEEDVVTGHGGRSESEAEDYEVAGQDKDQ